MPDRPDDPRQPGSSDTPDYKWLYGGAGDQQQPPPDDDSDHTRVLPTAGRHDAPPPASSRSSRPSGPVPPAAPGGPTVPPRERSPIITPDSRGPRRRRPRIGRIIVSLIVIWVAFLVAVPLWTWSKVDKVDAIPASSPADQPGTNFLLVGSDSREGLTKAQNRKLGTGGVTVDGGRTDTIMILHTGSGPSLLMSIPRDSLVPIPGHSTQKINAAFALGGPKLLVKTIQQDTGLHIDHYVEIGLGGFVNIVDAVGGVQICPKTHVVDPRANLNVKKGCQNADGATALGWARSRHAFALGDIEREEHQRVIVNEIGSKAKSPWSIINPFRYYKLNKAASTSLKVSKGTNPLNMVDFAWAMGRVNGKSGKTCGIPIANLSVQWDHTRALKFLSYLKADRTADIPASLCTKSGLPS